MLGSGSNKKGIIATILFHGALFLLLYFTGFTPPHPLPAEEGILINFGVTEQGSGNLEPSYTPSQRSEEKASPADESEPQPADEEIVTQDFEEAPSVETGDQQQQEEIQQQESAEEIERRREEERRRREEEERKKQQEAMENMVKDAFSQGKSTESNKSTDEGITGGDGNQGSIDGSVNTDNREGTSSGDNGVSYSLEGRVPQHLPKPEYEHQIEGKVVVEVTVNKAGEVTNANPGIKGSTTLDDNLLKAAREAALQARFDRSENAPAFQKGSITYYFRLQ